jgi:hypothetical protein
MENTKQIAKIDKLTNKLIDAINDLDVDDIEDEKIRANIVLMIRANR